MMNRREFCRKATVAGAAAALAPLISACQEADIDSEVVEQATAPATPEPSPQAATPRPTATAEPPEATVAPTAEPTETPAPEPTATIVVEEQTSISRVALVRTSDRASGVAQAIELLGLDSVAGKQVLLKPNFNSADPAPGSTHPDTLRALVEALNGMKAASITVGDRSGMGNTRSVMEQLGVTSMAQELGYGLLVFDELAEEDWSIWQGRDFHWSEGFAVPRQLLEAECVVQTCNLKTHRYGGHFTLSLKNSVGFAAKNVGGRGHNYMSELHNSPHQRRMIAEINTAYTPALVVMDGVEAFIDGGPATGKKANTEVVLAATDRIAIDAVGVALLRMFGTTEQVSRGSIFEQEQIARAVELGLGAENPEQIELITADADSAAYAERIHTVLTA